MKTLLTLGERVRAEWEAVACDPDLFDVAATRALEASRPVNFDRVAFGGWLADVSLPPQHTVDESFGQPSVTIHHDERFRIDVLFWHTATTGIHEHGFCGAFTVLEGSSLHTVYSFTERKAITDALALGDVHFDHLEVLRKGAIRTIPTGTGLTHSLFHLDSPSVSLVVRTPQTRREREYKPPSVAIDPSYRPEAHVKRLQYLAMLARTNSPEYARFAASLVRADDPLLAFRTMVRVGADDPTVFEQLCERAGALFPDAIDDFRRAADEELRRITIMSRRRTVVDPELRLFLALLINFLSREAIDAALSDLFPHRAPVDILFEWMQRLTAATDTGLADDAVLNHVLRMLLEGVPDEAMAGRILSAEQCDAERVRMVCELALRIRALPMLSPLFR
jgi:hypothetical protein